MPEVPEILAPVAKLTRKESDLREVDSLLTRAILLLDRNVCEEQVQELLGLKARMKLKNLKGKMSSEKS